MHLFITGTTTLQHMAAEFCKIYPSLRLAFFKRKNNPFQSFKKIDNLQLSLIDLDCIVPDSHLSIQFWQTTSAVEKLLSTHTGLKVEIMRKYATKWIRTDGSDDLTLEEQNQLSETVFQQPY